MKKNYFALIVGVVFTLCGSGVSRADIVLNWWDDGGVLNFAGSGTWDGPWDGSGSANSTSNVVVDAGTNSWYVRRYANPGGFRRDTLLPVLGGSGSLDLGASATPSTPPPVSSTDQSYFVQSAGGPFTLYAFGGTTGTMNYSDSFVLPSLTLFTLTAGTQTYQNGSETLTIHYGSAPMAAVPEPTTTLGLLGLVAASFLRRRRRVMVC